MTLTAVVTAVPAATEIRLSRSDGPFFSSLNSTLNRGLGTVIVDSSNHVEYEFIAVPSWNGTVSVYARNATHTDISTISVTVFGGESFH